MVSIFNSALVNDDQWDIEDLIKEEIINLGELKTKLNQALIENQPILEIKDLHCDIEWILKPFSDSSNVVCQNLKIQVLETLIELVIKSASKKLETLYLKALSDELSLYQRNFQVEHIGDKDA